MTAAPPLTLDDWPVPWSADELAELAQALGEMARELEREGVGALRVLPAM